MTLQCSTLILLLYSVVLLRQVTESVAVSSPSLKPRAIPVRVRVGIQRVALATKNLRFPNIIPLLHGNSIINVEKRENRHFEISHTASTKSFIFPMRKKTNSRNAIGFVFKESSLGAYPVPLENAMLLINLVPLSSTSGWLHIWIVSYGIYSSSQAFSQRLFTRSLINEFADNARRFLGVSKCPDLITVSGLCNNVQNTLSGTTMHELWSPVARSRPRSTVLSAMQPNVRIVSNIIVKNTHQRHAPYQVNTLFVFFGQFIDHDIVLTPGERNDREAFVPIDELATKTRMPFTRAGILRYKYTECCTEGYGPATRVWQNLPFNRLTSFIDGSAVYGSNHLRLNTIRSFTDGKIALKNVGSELYLPFNSRQHIRFTLHNEPNDHDPMLFVSGDVRANENTFLAAIHTLFAREHNRVCDSLRKWLSAHGHHDLLEDKWLFPTARKIIAAEIQSITFNEFIPILLGPNSLPPYRGYNPRIDARISTLHSSFAYRWGHSAIAESYNLRDRRNQQSTVKLRELFFNTMGFLKFGVDNLVSSAVKTSAMDTDEQIVDSLRDTLFNPPKNESLDLASLNIQRGRDFGVPRYLEVQALYRTGSGLSNIPPALRKKLMKAYKNINEIDAFVGCMCENKKPGALLGPLCWKINQEQFLRLRDGDRFYYENIQWHSAIRDMPLIRHIRNNRFQMADLVFANTKLNPALYRRDSSLFKTFSLA